MLNERLRAARKAKNLTQEDLARKVNTKKTTISNYETGYSSPSNEMLNDLANVLEVSTDYLLGRLERPDLYIVDENGNLTIVEVKGSRSKGDSELEDLLNDPELEIWHKELADTPEEIRKQALDYLRFLKAQEKGRKPGDKQQKK